MILTMHMGMAQAFTQLGTAKNYKSAPFAQNSSAEIWSRVRDQFHLNAPTSMPSMQKQIRKLTRSQNYVNELAQNASPYLYFMLDPYIYFLWIKWFSTNVKKPRNTVLF